MYVLPDASLPYPHALPILILSYFILILEPAGIGISIYDDGTAGSS